MQAKRKDFAQWVDTHLSGSTPDYTREGIGVEALAFEYDADIDSFKSILDDVASNTFKSYSITSSISDKRIELSDPMWPYLDYLRQHCTAGETTLIEINMTTGNNGTYNGLLYNVLVTIDSFLGEDAVIGYSIAVNGTPKIGTVTFNGDGKPVFTETVSL